MMMRLYRFTCEANYPICEGEIIFALSKWISQEQALILAVDLAKDHGFYNWDEPGATIEYLGTFMPASEQSSPYIISLQNGEY